MNDENTVESISAIGHQLQRLKDQFFQHRCAGLICVNRATATTFELEPHEIDLIGSALLKYMREETELLRISEE